MQEKGEGDMALEVGCQGSGRGEMGGESALEDGVFDAGEEEGDGAG